VWVDREGHEEPVPLEARDYQSFALSPDGRRIALTVTNSGNDNDIWIWSSDRQTMSRLTFEAEGQEAPLWTRDGSRIVYSDYSGDGVTLKMRSADGTGAPVAVLPRDGDHVRVQVVADGWTADGRLVFEELRQRGTWQLKTVAPGANPDERVLLTAGSFRAGAATLSADGRWLAYVSDESGRPETYVRPYPAIDDGKWQVSTAGATTPRWSADNRMLLFLIDGQVMGAPVTGGATFAAAAPQLVARTPGGTRVGLRTLGGDFEISPDGRRFLFMKANERTTPANLNVVLNWTTTLRR
jgi:serine/threonine-protein kinase